VTRSLRRAAIRLAGAAAIRLAGVALLVGLALPASASAATSADPPANRSLSRATRVDCSADPIGSACISEALADINAARAAEGVPAMVLPPDFASMSVPVQLLNLANLERVDRGLAPILGLSAALNQDAQAGAAQDADPMPTHFYGNAATSNWAGGEDSTLEADFDWMYDDGLGSGNVDCTSSDQAGCWGHRHDILWPFAAPIAMGAGSATGQYGPSMTELFVGGDTKTAAGEADAPIVRPSLVRPNPAEPAPSTGPTGSAAGAASSASSSHPRPQTNISRVRVVAGRLELSATCGARRGSVCKLSITVASAAGRSARRVGSSFAVSILAGQTRVIRVPLSRALRRLVSTRHTLSVRVLIKRCGGGRAATLVTRTLTVGLRP
jgi:hypothetical protein